MKYLNLLYEELATHMKEKEDLKKTFESVNPDLLQIMERYVAVNVKNEMTVGEMAKNYMFFLEEVNKEEKYFLEHGAYRYCRLSDVMEKVYNDRNYMRKYMVGLAISLILWPQHREYFQFFLSFLN